MARRRSALRDRARYRFDQTLARSTGTLLGWLAVCCLAVVVPVSTALVWMDPAAPRSLSGRLTAVWRTSAETLRLGAVTGAPLRMLLSVLLGLIALLCVSTLVGVITTGLGDRVAELRRGRSMVLESGHVVVLGWSDQVFTIVGELAAAHGDRGRPTIAVLADRDSTGMEGELLAVPGVRGRARLVCRTGSPADPAALALVGPATAASVLVLPAAEGEADTEVVRVLLALRALTGPEGGPRVLSAVRDGRRLPAARLAAGARGTVLETDGTTARLLVQAARRPGLTSALRDLLDFAGAEFHLADAPHLAGLTFRQIALRHDTSCAVGYLRADGGLLLTPPAGAVLTAGDRLVVVAHDDRPAAPTDHCAHVDPTAISAATPAADGPVRVLLLGWNRRGPLIADLLRRGARPGSVLDAVAGPDSGLLPGQQAGEPDDGRLAVTHRPGDPTRPEVARGLDPFGYDSVIVLGPDTCQPGERPDDRALLTLLALRSSEETAGRALPVVAELHDHRTERLAPLGRAADTVVRGRLTALLMAQLTHHPSLAPVFDEIFATRGGALDLRPAGEYVLPGREASFATVVAAALDRGQCAIGYHAPEPHPADVVLCPRKSDRRVWSAEDRILVLLPAPDASATADPADRDLPHIHSGRRSDDTPAEAPPA
ncbi:CASTOR/POLLUX-related putative ion channel [Streptomyces sp. 900105245]